MYIYLYIRNRLSITGGQTFIFGVPCAGAASPRSFCTWGGGGGGTG